jgi:hypothetical protein
VGVTALARHNLSAIPKWGIRTHVDCLGERSGSHRYPGTRVGSLHISFGAHVTIQSKVAINEARHRSLRNGLVAQQALLEPCHIGTLICIPNPGMPQLASHQPLESPKQRLSLCFLYLFFLNETLAASCVNDITVT